MIEELEMYMDYTPLQIVGQVLIAFTYVIMGVMNATTRKEENIERMEFLGVPQAPVVLWVGIAVQLTGGFMVMFDQRTDLGAVILIVFTIVATAIFHRPWLGQDSRTRHMHLSCIFANSGLIGALLLFV